MLINKLDALSLKDLRAVCLLADTQHFHHAAERCQISQPALSSIIKKVENILGVSLFKRSSRSFEVTLEGQRIIPQLRSTLAGLEKTFLPETERAPLSGSFRLGFIPTIGPYLIPQIIHPVLRKYPKLELSFSELTTEKLVSQVLRGELDAALVALPVQHSKIFQQALFQEALLLAVPAQHHFTKLKNLSVAHIKQEELLLMEQGHCLRKETLEICGHNEQGTRTVHATSLETLLYMVQANIGYTFVPQMAANKRKNTSGIRFLKFKEPAPTRTVGIIWLKDSLIIRELELFSSCLQSALRLKGSAS